MAAIASVAALAAGVVAWRAAAGPGDDGWDHRVAAIARFVAGDRGLTFAHAVPVVFLDRAQFQRQLGGGGGSAAGAAEALGLPGPPSGGDGSDTVGFYDPDRRAVYVLGRTMTPFVRVTVAHELTHVLQDQRLGLARLDALPDSDQDAVSALVEGDAVAVEQDYENTLSSSDRRLYDQEAGGGVTGGTTAAADAAGFPYDFGPVFVDALLAVGGNGRVDRAFRRPPTTQAEILDPSLYLAGTYQLAVAPPPVPAGAAADGPATVLGQATLTEALGQTLGYTEAWTAASGWAGDSEVTYRAGAATCAEVAVTAVSVAAADRLQAAGQRWAQTVVDGSARRMSPTGVVLSSCGAQAGVRPAAPDAYDVLVARADLIDRQLTGQSPPAAARAECEADHVVSVLGPAATVAWDQQARGAPTELRVDGLLAYGGCAGAAPDGFTRGWAPSPSG